MFHLFGGGNCDAEYIVEHIVVYYKVRLKYKHRIHLIQDLTKKLLEDITNSQFKPDSQPAIALNY